MKTQKNLLNALKLLINRDRSIFETQETHAEVELYLSSLKLADQPDPCPPPPSKHHFDRREPLTAADIPPASPPTCRRSLSADVNHEDCSPQAKPQETPRTRRDTVRKHRSTAAPASEDPVMVHTDSEVDDHEDDGNRSEVSLSYGTSLSHGAIVYSLFLSVSANTPPRYTKRGSSSSSSTTASHPSRPGSARTAASPPSSGPPSVSAGMYCLSYAVTLLMSVVGLDQAGTGGVIYLHHRNLFGHVKSSSIVPPPPGVDLVPSLGILLDDIVDAFGLSNEFILKTHEIYLRSRDKHGFVGSMCSFTTVAKARLIWKHIDVDNASGGALRRRKYMMPSVA